MSDRTRIKNLETVLESLVNYYVANRGGAGPMKAGEFICCVTPRHASEMTKAERAKDRCWSKWDRARRLLGEKLP
jgi:hypothetical protein